MRTPDLDPRGLEAAARELFESERNTAMVEYPEWDSPANIGKPLYIEDAKAAITAALPHLTAQDVPHVAREAWGEGWRRAVDAHPSWWSDPTYNRNPYAEEATDDHA